MKHQNKKQMKTNLGISHFTPIIKNARCGLSLPDGHLVFLFYGFSYLRNPMAHIKQPTKAQTSLFALSILKIRTYGRLG